MRRPLALDPHPDIISTQLPQRWVAQGSTVWQARLNVHEDGQPIVLLDTDSQCLAVGLAGLKLVD